MQTNIETWNESDLKETKGGAGELGLEHLELGRDCLVAFVPRHQ